MLSFPDTQRKSITLQLTKAEKRLKIAKDKEPTMFPISQHATRRCLIDRNPEQLKQRDQLARMMVVEDQWLEMGPILPDFGTRWVIGSLEWRLWNDLGSALPTSPVCLCLRSTFIGFSMLLSLQSPTEGQLLNRQKWLVELSAIGTWEYSRTPGRVKPTGQRLCSNRSHKIVEGYQDYTQTIVAVLSEVSPENKGATLIVVTRTGPRPQMLWNTFPSVPRAAARPSNQLPPRSHSPGKNSCSDLNPRLLIFYAVLRQARLSRERLQDYKPWSKKWLPPNPFTVPEAEGAASVVPSL